MDINTTREELAACITSEVEAYPYLPGDAELPCVVIGFPSAINYHKAMKAVEFRIPVLVIVSRNSEDEAQQELGDLLSPAGLPAEFEGGSGSWRSVKVETAGQLQDFTLGDNRKAMGVEMELVIEGS